MISEDLHARLCVRIVSRLELQLVEAKPLEERVQYADEVRQPQAAVCDDALHLVELRQVCRV